MILGIFVADCRTRPGTWVNYAPVSETGTRVEHNDIISFGKIAFRFEVLRQPVNNSTLIHMKKTIKSPYPVHAATHAGMSGKSNEDAFGYEVFSRTGHAPVLVGVLADGIGGHRAGEVASSLGVRLILEYFEQHPNEKTASRCRSAINHASEMILLQGRNNLHQSGMGSTCALICLRENRLHTASLGDSRIYLYRRQRLYQLSTDHTWVQDAIENGLLDAGAGRNHPHAHIIRRYLGSDPPSEVDCRMRLLSRSTSHPRERAQGLTLKPDDLILVCSDGLTDMVPDEEIREILHHNKPRAACGKLITAANEHGGLDNITVLLVKIPQFTPAI